MRNSELEDWAYREGGLRPRSAASYVSYLRSVEQSYGMELDMDWQASRLANTRSRLSDDDALNRNTRRNRLAALTKYELFCSVSSRR